MQTLTVKDVLIAGRKIINEGNLQAMNKVNGVIQYCANVNPHNPKIRCIVGAALNKDIIDTVLAEYEGRISKIKEDMGLAYTVGVGGLKNLGLISVPDEDQFREIKRLQTKHDLTVQGQYSFEEFLEYFEALEEKYGLNQ